jgi:phage baseplate assembly protein W
MDNNQFLGIGWAFPPAFDKGGARMTEGFNDVKESLRILFSTNKGERIFRPEYGCALSKWTFSKINLSEKTLLRDVIKEAIRIGEPRITVETIEIEIRNELEGELWIHIDYRINSTATSDNLVFPIYLKEGE